MYKILRRKQDKTFKALVCNGFQNVIAKVQISKEKIGKLCFLKKLF